ncbi:DNA adenine methylase [Paractinoplanes hotanensis]|nr:DNA adenine methylase [Actinoplanes hotanensis]
MEAPQAVADERLFRHSVVSPLRYPGAKRQLVPIMEFIVRANVPRPKLIVEPFCGGASMTLRLLGTGVVPHGILADFDPLVAAFWKTAAFDSNWLIEALSQEPVTVERWDWWRSSSPTRRRDKALKCLFLNRTTFSGILHGRAGPIGGRSQNSAYKIDCRFGVDGLVRRIRGVADLAASGRLIDVWQADWKTTLNRTRSRFPALSGLETLVYVDPPYVDKAEWLYPWSFTGRDHKKLASYLRAEAKFAWILSYDDHRDIRDLYLPEEKFSVLHVSQRYTAAGSESRSTKDELLVTNLETIPQSDSYREISRSN